MVPISLDDSPWGKHRPLYHPYPGEITMTLPLFSRVILTQDILDHALLTGDIGTIVEHHPATSEYPEGYEVECFTDKGETIAVVSVAATGLRQATNQDIMYVRQLTPASP